MYSKEPTPQQLDADYLQTSKEYDLINKDHGILKVCRHDLLLISTEKIDFTVKNDLEKQLSPEYINKLLSGSSAMLVLVEETAGVKEKEDLIFYQDYLEVDLSKKHFLELKER